MKITIETFSDVVLVTIFMMSWIGGIVLTQGFWSTATAIFIPPWGWYLLMELWFTNMGWIHG